MAEESITLEVVTPLELAVKAQVSEVTAPSVQGEFGVLTGHRPLLAALEHGAVKYVEGNTLKLAAVGPGFAEVGPSKVVLLVERWVNADDIDADEARDELAQAELKVRELEGKELTDEYEEARLAERWATVRIDVAAEHRKI